MNLLFFYFKKEVRIIQSKQDFFPNLRVLSSIDMRNVDESLDTGFARNLCKTSSSVNVDVVKLEVPRLELAPDQVECDVGVSQRFPDRFFVLEVKG